MEILYIILSIVGISLIGLISFAIYKILKSPYRYPSHKITFDISGKRSPIIDDLIDTYINKHGFEEFINHYESVNKWKATCNKNINKSPLKKLRRKQFEKAINDKEMFCFELVRKQTRYKQINYVKTPYEVYVTIHRYFSDIKPLQKRYEALSAINFECTLSEYNSKKQRRLITKSVREQVAIRDNFTCRNCGKYMPDGVGLHIDHIIPISKGGRSVMSNLQVLCSKCNGKKSSK